MNEETPEETAGPTLSRVAHSEGRSADHVSQRNTKSLSTWKWIGKIEREHMALKISIDTPFDGRQVYHISAQDLQGIIGPKRIPGEIVRIRIGIDGTEVIEGVGRAYRSRSGKALCMTLITLGGGEAIVSWSALQKVVLGQQQAAHVSTLIKPENHQEKTMGGLSHGLARGF